jgi:hypothetical protein
MNNIKFVNAQQAWTIYKYNNTKKNLFKTNATIQRVHVYGWFVILCKLCAFIGVCGCLQTPFSYVVVAQVWGQS